MPTRDPLRDVLRVSVIDRFTLVAKSPEPETKFPVGPQSAKRLGYDPGEVDALPVDPPSERRPPRSNPPSPTPVRSPCRCPSHHR